MNVSTFPPSQDFPDTAEDWLARLLSPECGHNDYAAFEDWLAASPGNALAYADAERIHRLAGALAADPVLAGTTRRPVASVRPVRRKRRLPALAWAAVLLLALGGGFGLWLGLQRAAPVGYATVIGEQRQVDLPDGSRLLLDTDSSVQVAYERSRRRVELLRGRLQANVARDASRPFVVVSGAGSVRALGTVFQVEQQDGTTLIRLLEGRVAVDTHRTGADAPSLELRPLQQLSYDADGRLGAAESIDRSVAEGWTRGRLVFKERRLADLLAEVNRYSRNHLTLAEPALGEIRISGVFDARDQASLVEALHRGWGLQARRAANGEIALHAAE